jgi:hypothetical protein
MAELNSPNSIKELLGLALIEILNHSRGKDLKSVALYFLGLLRLVVTACRTLCSLAPDTEPIALNVTTDLILP